MRTKIYQINSKRDVNRVKFEGLDLLERYQGSSAVDPSIYDEVFNAEIDETDLEAIYQRFNTVGHPLHRGHSLSVSDVVVNDNGAFFCDSIGFQPIAFDESQTQKPDNLVQPEYPNLIFARDGEIYTLNGLRYLVIGGAYSVDKYYRLSHGWGWWPDEQPSPEIKTYVEQQIQNNPFDIVLSHTCPFKYEPTEMFLGGIDQSTVDDSTERWLDTIEEAIEYKAWFCGHWHTDKRIDKMHFLFHSFESDEQFRNSAEE